MPALGRWSNAPQGQIISESDGIFAESFSPDGRTILTGSRRNSVRLWDAATCQPIGQPIPLSDALLRDTANAQGAMVSPYNITSPERCSSR